MISQPKIQGKVDQPCDYKEANKFFNYLLWTTLLVYLLGVIFYGEKFRFWERAYSHIGRIHTPGGMPNTISLMIFGLGMLFCSWICFRTSSIFKGRLNHYLLRICSVGYLLNLIPCDLINTLHSVGGAMVFGSLWLFTVVHISELSHSGNSNKFYYYHLLLQGTVLPYAFLFAIKSPTQHAIQKVAFLGLMLTLKLVLLGHVRIESGNHQNSDEISSYEPLEAVENRTS